MTTATVSDSSITMASIMLPKDGNPMGFVHGGVIAKYIDEAGAVVASRHAHNQVVTRSFDQLSFHHHVAIGNLLHLKASLNFVGHSSMEVGIRVEEEEPIYTLSPLIKTVNQPRYHPLFLKQQLNRDDRKRLWADVPASCKTTLNRTHALLTNIRYFGYVPPHETSIRSSIPYSHHLS